MNKRDHNEGKDVTSGEKKGEKQERRKYIIQKIRKREIGRCKEKEYKGEERKG